MSELIFVSKDSTIADIKLSPTQKKFEKLIKKLEKLDKKMILNQKNIDEANKCYYEYGVPAKSEQYEQSKSFLLEVYQYYKTNNKNPKNLTNEYKDFITDYIDYVLTIVPLERDAELDPVFKFALGESLTGIAENEVVRMKEMIKAQFARMGVKIDMSDVENTEAAVMDKMREVTESMKETHKEYFQEAKEKKLTKKQQEKAAEQKKAEDDIKATMNRSIHEIFRQLTKIFHPDLEKDMSKKQEKEELMKKLNIAYESKDLSALLKMEMMWVNEQSYNIDKMDESKLKLYIPILEQQVFEREEEVYVMMEQQSLQTLKIFCHPERVCELSVRYKILSLQKSVKDIQIAKHLYSKNKSTRIIANVLFNPNLYT
jgi:hypothetical protein